MQISSTGVNLAGTDYTWQQTWKFFVLGALYAGVTSIGPILWQLWHNYQTYSDPVDWSLLWGTIASAVGPALYLYWREHRALLKWPPIFDIPSEFQPQKIIAERHTTETVTGTDAGTVVEKHSEHDTKVTIIPPKGESHP